MKSLAKKLGGLIVLFLISLSQFLYSQATDIHVFQEWAKNEGLTNHSYKARTVNDAYGHIYIIGGTISAYGDYDWLLTKLDATSGAEIWSVSFDGGVGADDFGVDIITIGATDDLFICGAMTVDTSEGFNLGIARVDTSGAIVWIDTYDNGQSYPLNNDVPSKLVYDYNGGYVCVTGMSQDAGTLEDFITLQYDPGAGGPPLWAARYDRNSLQDGAGNIFYNGTNVVVTGMVQKTPFYHGIESIEYDASGSIVTATPPSAYDLDSITKINDISIAPNGDIYVAGYLDNPSTGRNAKVIKLDSLLTVRWQFNSSFTGNDEANSVAIDNNGAFYVGGYRTATTEKDFLFAKLDTAGSLIWGPLTYNGPINGDDELEAIALDNNDNPIVTGSSELDSLNLDYYTMRYDTSGTIIWSINYNGLANNNDVPTDISIDPFNNIFVIGQSQDSSGVTSQYITVKYVEHELFNVPDADTIPSNFDATPNWGQLLNADTVTNVNTTVKYYSTGPSVYFENTKLMHLFSKLDTSATANDTLVRVDMVLTSDTTRRVFAKDNWGWYSNYYFPHTAATKGLANVPAYKNIVYPEIYKNIDLHVSANIKGVKEQFVLKQGSNSTDIAFVYEGADTVYIDNDDLVIATALDTIRYKRPEASQIDSSGNNVTLGWDPCFKMINDTVFFDSIQGINSNLPLVIEMNQGTGIFSIAGGGDNLDWSTYYGSSLKEEIYDLDANAQGSMFIAGYTESVNIPTQPGFAQAIGTHSGSRDAFYTKFNNEERIIHRTFFGGSGDDVAYSIAAATDVSEISFVGSTNSSVIPDFASGGNLDDNTLGGSLDGFIVTVNNLGNNIEIDSYIGGIGIDICQKVSAPVSGKLILGGTSSSGTGFPLHNLGGAYNQSHKGGYDGFVMSVNTTTFDQDWSTFIGGSGDDILKDVMLSGGNNEIGVYLSTETTSGTTATSPVTSPTGDGSLRLTIPSGAHSQTTYQGGDNDGYVLAFDNQKRIEWASYLGTNVKDVASFFDNSLDDNGNCGLDIDKNGRIVIAGTLFAPFGTSSITGITYPSLMTPSTYSQTDFATTAHTKYIAKFEDDHSLVWYTLFGGTQTSCENYATDVVTDAVGNIYVTGSEHGSDMQSSGNYCGIPSSGEFAICNFTGLGYLETDNTGSTFCNFRTFITAFTNEGEIAWSTRYGNPNNNSGQAVDIGKIGPDEFLYLAGWSGATNYTFRNLASTSNDWINPAYSGNTDGTVARFNVNNLVIGIQTENSPLSSMIVYPNPASSELFLNVNSDDVDYISILNVNGQMVHIYKGTVNNVLDVSMLTAGVYCVSVTTLQNQTYYCKFVKL
jgi:hypothetical protein